jgi:hypothetical protein
MSGRGNKTNRIAGLVGRPFDVALFAHVGEFVIGEQAEMFIDWCWNLMNVYVYMAHPTDGCG